MCGSTVLVVTSALTVVISIKKSSTILPMIHFFVSSSNCEINVSSLMGHILCLHVNSFNAKEILYYIE